MKEIIVLKTIEHLKKDGLKFSIDDISKELHISKKTVYKYFPNKEALAIATFKMLYESLINELEGINYPKKNDILKIYLSSFKIIDDSLFNKFQLNDSSKNYVLDRHQELFSLIKKYLPKDEETRFIIDSTLQNIAASNLDDSKETKLMERIEKLWNI